MVPANGGERRERDEEKARRRVAEPLPRPGWPAAELAKRRPGDADKAALARQLRAETMLSWQWIAGALHICSWTCVSNLLGQKGRKSVNGEGDTCL